MNIDGRLAAWHGWDLMFLLQYYLYVGQVSESQRDRHSLELAEYQALLSTEESSSRTSTCQSGA